jgi:hypothetical protein
MVGKRGKIPAATGRRVGKIPAATGRRVGKIPVAAGMRREDEWVKYVR